MAQSIKILASVGLICFVSGSRLVFSEDEHPAPPNPGVKVCVGLMNYLNAPYDLNSEKGRRVEYEALREELKGLSLENLHNVQDADVPFLAKRIARVELAYRGFQELDRFFLPKEFPSQASFTRRAKERLLTQFSERYAREEYRGWWEYKLLFEIEYHKFALSGLATIGSADSVPLLESFYEWEPNRLREIGIGKPVRLDILAAMAKIRVPESYVALAKIWGGNTANDEEKKLIVESLAKDSQWTEVAAKLSLEAKETYRAFQAAIDHARPPEPSKESANKGDENTK